MDENMATSITTELSLLTVESGKCTGYINHSRAGLMFRSCCSTYNRCHSFLVGFYLVKDGFLLLFSFFLDGFLFCFLEFGDVCLFLKKKLKLCWQRWAEDLEGLRGYE